MKRCKSLPSIEIIKAISSKDTGATWSFQLNHGPPVILSWSVGFMRKWSPHPLSLPLTAVLSRAPRANFFFSTWGSKSSCACLRGWRLGPLGILMITTVNYFHSKSMVRSIKVWWGPPDDRWVGLCASCSVHKAMALVYKWTAQTDDHQSVGNAHLGGTNIISMRLIDYVQNV